MLFWGAKGEKKGKGKKWDNRGSEIEKVDKTKIREVEIFPKNSRWKKAHRHR